MTMTGVERHWLSIVLPSFIDPAAGGFGLRPGEVDFVRGAQTMYDASSPMGRIGMRAALLVAMLSPVLLLGRLRSFAALDSTERAAVLARICSHRLYMLRGLGVLLKLAASMAMFRVASVRGRTHYDHRAVAQPVRARVALPLLMLPSPGAA